MRYRIPVRSLPASPACAVLLLAACGSGSTSSQAPAAPSTASSTPAPASTSTTTSSSSSGAGTAAGTPIVEARTVAGHGAVLVAASNQMTLYTFAKDVAGSGRSSCSGGCLTAWPALIVPAGMTPALGPGAHGQIAAITRSDTGQRQCTYNGLPLYFFHNDHAPGDTNGSYPEWNLVTP